MKSVKNVFTFLTFRTIKSYIAKFKFCNLITKAIINIGRFQQCGQRVTKHLYALSYINNVNIWIMVYFKDDILRFVNLMDPLITTIHCDLISSYKLSYDYIINWWTSLYYLDIVSLIKINLRYKINTFYEYRLVISY